MKRLVEQASFIATLEPEFTKLSDDELRGKTVEFRQRLENGEQLEELLFESFAAVREARLRESDQRIFDVQMMGGIVLHEGDIAEMKTGEGKTFVASLALYLNALPGNGVHLVTVNDYLAQRDAEWNRGVFERLGSDGRLHREQHAVRRSQGCLRRGRHLRDELGVRLRLPARQHVDQPRCGRAARTHVRDRGRGRLDPRRRGSHTADHLRRADDRRAHLPRLRADREGPLRGAVEGHEARGRGARAAVRLPLRREAQDDLADRVRDREGRARRRGRQPLQPGERAARQPPDPGAEGGGALQARRRLRGAGQRGEDRRRVHRPHHGGAPLERGAAPGRRGQGRRRDPGGAPDARHDHAPELLPPLREARRHDRHREDRGEGVRRDLQPERRRDPDQRRRSPATTRTT